MGLDRACTKLEMHNSQDLKVLGLADGCMCVGWDLEGPGLGFGMFITLSYSSVLFRFCLCYVSSLLFCWSDNIEKLACSASGIIVPF